MGSRYAHDSAYNGDDNTFTRSRRNEYRRPDSRYRSQSEDDYFRPRSRRPPSPQRSRSFRDNQKTSSPYKTVGKVALGIIVVEAVAHFYSKWTKNKVEERERDRRRERKRQFEKAKARRRREEERSERQQDERERMAMEKEEFEGSEMLSARRLGYVDDVVERSPSRPVQRIEPAQDNDDAVDEFEGRRPERHVRSRSRPAMGGTLE